MKVPAPDWRIVYQGTDITRDIAPMVTRVRYTDRAHGKSDEIEVTVEDRGGRWRGAWYPAKGDTIDAEIGRTGELMPAGTFKVDEVEFSSQGRRGDQVTIRGQAAAITQDLRTKKSRSWEGQTLRGIADTIAGAHGLEVVGPVADVPFERVSQDDESDLAFLKRMAETYGHAASVRGEQLVFIRLRDLRDGQAVARYTRRDLGGFRLKDKESEVYKEATVRYQDPETKEMVSKTVQAENVASGDTLKRTVRAENEAQAEEKARALLDEHNRTKFAGDITVAGEPRLVAGAKVELAELGELSGRYLVTSSTHSASRRGGYTTQAEVERV